MSTPITHTQRIHQPFVRASGGRRPWAHPGVASERARRAERAYAGELVHAEHHARVRAAAAEASR